MKVKLIFALTFLSSIFLSSCGETNFKAINSSKPLDIKYVALDKKLLYQEGEAKPFALFFYTSTCGICAIQAPILQEIYEEREFNFIAVIGDKPAYDDALKYSLNMSFPIIYESMAVNYLRRAVGGIYGVPVLFIYNSRGQMYKKFIGLTPKSVIKEAINGSSQ